MATKKRPTGKAGAPVKRASRAAKRWRETKAERKVHYILIASLAERVGTTKLSSKNQITLPARIVRLLGLEPGHELKLTLSDRGSIIVDLPPVEDRTTEGDDDEVNEVASTRRRSDEVGD